MALINVSGLTFSYPGSYDNIFENVSFQIDTSWKLGFCGRNGRGKTTFLNLLMRKFEYSGAINTNTLFSYFPFEVAASSKNTLQVIEEIAPDCLLWQIEKELSTMEVSLSVLERPFKTLSGGEKTKVLLAGLFLRENNFLLIDEPTNHLDTRGREIVAKYLKSKTGFILVSHDRDFLDEIVDHILSINKSNIEIQSGNFSSWYHNKELCDNFEIDENKRLKKDIKRLHETAKEKAAWSDKIEASKIGEHVFDRGRVGHLAAKMMKRSKAIEKRQHKAIEEKSTLLKNIETTDNLKIHPLKHHNNRLIEMENVSLFYGDNVVANNINFTLTYGERLVIYGGNGSGKSSLIKLITGDSPPQAHGKINIASNLIVSYVQQDTHFLSGNLTDYAHDKQIDESLFKAILRKLDFSRVQFEKDISGFSSGQKKKVLIARSLCEKAHVYIWDEPLNYIDILSRIQIEELLDKFKPTMIFVEHDRAFCRKIASRAVNLL